MGVEDIIGIDAYGGDEVDKRTALQRIVTATKTVAREHPDKRFVMVGECIRVHQELGETPENIDVIHGADQKYGAVKRLAEMTAAGDIGGFYTLANTKIIVPLVNRHIGTFEACAYAFPNNRFLPLLAELPKSRASKGAHSCYLLDVGAVPDVTHDNYVMYAQVGRLYATAVGKRKPVTIGLLNIGSEANKGTGALQEAYDRLHAVLPDHPPARERNLDRFIGNVEPYVCMFDHDKGREEPRPVTVVVGDAFTLNIMIKSASTGADFLKEEIRYEIQHGGWCEKGGAALSKPMYRRIKERVNRYGVATFPCIKRPVYKGHGTTSIEGIVAGLEHQIEDIDAKSSDAMRVALESYAKEIAARERRPETKAF